MHLPLDHADGGSDFATQDHESAIRHVFHQACKIGFQRRQPRDPLRRVLEHDVIVVYVAQTLQLAGIQMLVKVDQSIDGFVQSHTFLPFHEGLSSVVFHQRHDAGGVQGPGLFLDLWQVLLLQMFSRCEQGLEGLAQEGAVHLAAAGVVVLG